MTQIIMSMKEYEELKNKSTEEINELKRENERLKSENELLRRDMLNLRVDLFNNKKYSIYNDSKSSPKKGGFLF